MKRSKIAVLLLFCIFCSYSLFAADSIEELSADERRQYMSSSLSIQTRNHTVVSADYFGWDWGWRTGYYRARTTTEWYPYLGARAISRAEFYQLAGYPELAQEELRIEKTNRNLSIAGWSLIGVGATAIFTGLIMSMISPKTDDIGLGLMIGGSVVSLASIPVFAFETKHNVSIEFAFGIADNYNKELLESF